MPITQSRMMALVNAAQDYKNALRSAQQIVKTNLIAARQGRASAADALEQIGLMVTEFGLLQHKIESAETIAIESKHFSRSVIHRNERSKQRQRELRGTPELTRHETEAKHSPEIYRFNSAPKATTAPETLRQPPALADNAYQAAMRVAAQLDAEEMQESLSPALREAFHQPPDEGQLPAEGQGQFADLPDLSASPPARQSASPSYFNAQALNAEAEAAVRGQATETEWTKLIADAQAKERAEFEALPVRRAGKPASLPANSPDRSPNPPDEKASES